MDLPEERVEDKRGWRRRGLLMPLHSVIKDLKERHGYTQQNNHPTEHTQRDRLYPSEPMDVRENKWGEK